MPGQAERQRADQKVVLELQAQVLEAGGIDGERALAAVETAAKGDANLMPPIVEAVERLATLGEISDRLRDVFGTFHESF